METTVLSLSTLALGELEAFAELMFLAAYTDGAVTAEERAAFRGQVVKNTHGRIDGALVDQLLRVIEVDLKDADREARLATIRDRLGDPRKRHAALVHAARVMVADGVLALDEVAFLRRAMEVLGEPPEGLDAVLREAREPG